MPEHCFDRDALPAPRRLLSHPNYDLVFSEGQHRAGTRTLQMHDHAGAVFQPQIAAADELRPALPVLCVYLPGKSATLASL